MRRAKASLPADYFEAIYRRDADPWRFTSSEYEREKYAATLAALPDAHYSRGLEVGCSIGVLTRLLAPRCDSLVAVDCVEAALNQARTRCADLPHVSFARMELPGQLPAGSFDLLVLSEVAYYWCAGDLDLMVAFAGRAVVSGGSIVLVHWTGETDYPLTGDEAAERFVNAAAPFTRVVHQSGADLYRIDVLQRLSAVVTVS